MLNALFMVDEIVTVECKWYKVNDGEYSLLKSKYNEKKLDIAR